MCTIVVLNQVHPEHPVVIAANRDEMYDRPATAPQVLDIEPRIVGGRDVRAEGTWMGATPDGLFVGLTNQRTWAAPDLRRRSRGEVVLKALRQGDTAGVLDFLSALDGRDYNPFNLVFGTATDMRVAYARSEDSTVETAPLPAGVHVLPNERLDSQEFPKVNRLLTQVTPRSVAPWDELVATFQQTLADHAIPAEEDVEEPPAGAPFPRALVRRLHAICIHTPVYGTRSSTVVALHPGRTERYLFADGPPCQATLQDVTDLLRDGSSP